MIVKVYVVIDKQDGKYVNMSAKVEDGYLVFDTDHFSTYVVTAEELDKAGTPGDSDGTNGSSDPNDNHNTGVALAIAPVLLAGAAVVVLKKRK